MGFESVSLRLGQILCEPGTLASHVYFPNDALVSVLAIAPGGKALEVGMVGRDGLFGVSIALGAGRSTTRALVQGSGTAMRLSAKQFSTELKRSTALQRKVSLYANSAMVTAMQIAACNNAHDISQRCARWILMTSDQLSRQTFDLTQAFLAHMLGARRSGVSQAAANLQRRGLIAYRRGSVRILNRAGLKAASCGCYDTIRKLMHVEETPPHTIRRA